MEPINHIYSNDFVVYWRTSARSKAHRDLISIEAPAVILMLYSDGKNHNDALIMSTFEVGGQKLVSQRETIRKHKKIYRYYNDFKLILGRFIFYMKDIQRKYQR